MKFMVEGQEAPKEVGGAGKDEGGVIMCMSRVGMNQASVSRTSGWRGSRVWGGRPWAKGKGREMDVVGGKRERE